MSTQYINNNFNLSIIYIGIIISVEKYKNKYIDIKLRCSLIYDFQSPYH